MDTHVIEHVPFYHSVDHQGIGKAAVVAGLDLYVRAYAASVADAASHGGLEFMCKRIGDMSDRAVLVAVRIVYRLYATAAWGIVFCRGHFELTSVRQRPYALDQTLSERAGADNDGPVHVLQRSGYDFRCRCGAGVNQHH